MRGGSRRADGPPGGRGRYRESEDGEEHQHGGGDEEREEKVNGQPPLTLGKRQGPQEGFTHRLCPLAS